MYPYIFFGKELIIIHVFCVCYQNFLINVSFFNLLIFRSAHKNGALSDRKDRERLKESHRSAKSPSAMETEGDQSIPAPKVASSVVRLINPFDDLPRASKVASKVIVKRKVPDVPK